MTERITDERLAAHIRVAETGAKERPETTWEAERRAALLELQELRREREWRAMDSALRDGTEIIVFHPVAGVCAAFCPAPGFAWHCMDGRNTTIGRRSGASIPSMTSFVEPPTRWMPLPEPPHAE